MLVEIYGKDSCPYCTKAKEACEYANIPYVYHNIVGSDATATKQDVQDRIKALGLDIEVKTVPQIFIDSDTYVGGYDSLVNRYPWAATYHNKR